MNNKDECLNKLNRRIVKLREQEERLKKRVECY